MVPVKGRNRLQRANTCQLPHLPPVPCKPGPGVVCTRAEQWFHFRLPSTFLFFLTKPITTLFWEVEAVSIFRKSKCQKSPERHNWEVKNGWCDRDKHQIANIWNSSPSGPWGEKCLCLLNWLPDDLALLCCVGCWTGRRSQRKVKYLPSTCYLSAILLDTRNVRVNKRDRTLLSWN